jgi:hypothetical protein
MTDNPAKRPRGKPFEQGNHGRPAGSKNRKTQILASLSKEDQDRLVRRAYEVAMEGDPTMLKFLLGGAMPKDRLIRLEQRVFGVFANEAADVIADALQAVCAGEITPSEGAQIAGLATQYSNALEKADIINRLDAIEAKLPNVRAR